MKKLTLQECADYLDAAAHINHSIDCGQEIIHTGISCDGKNFVLINDCFGETVLGEFA